MDSSYQTGSGILVELQRVWLDMIHKKWRHYNRKYLNSRLKPPQFVLDDAQQRLGSWDVRSRTMTLSLAHVSSALWVEVDLTLKHEMAHQVVDELFDERGCRPHGESFERACRLLELQHSPRLEVERPSSQVRVFERIRKLLSLGRSSNMHEAEAAISAANRLLLKHNLELADLREKVRHAYRWIGKPAARVPLERKIISSILQDFFFVRCIWIRTTQMSSGQVVRVLEILGQQHNLEIAEYVHDTLATTLDGLWNQYRRTQARLPNPRSARTSYRVGLLKGFREHLEGQQLKNEEQGLVWLGDRGAEQLMARRYPKRQNFSAGTYRIHPALQDGIQHGRKIRIQPGINDEQETAARRGLLLPE